MFVQKLLGEQTPFVAAARRTSPTEVIAGLEWATSLGHPSPSARSGEQPASWNSRWCSECVACMAFNSASVGGATFVLCSHTPYGKLNFFLRKSFCEHYHHARIKVEFRFEHSV
jgi:hypothetical protein